MGLDEQKQIYVHPDPKGRRAGRIGAQFASPQCARDRSKYQCKRAAIAYRHSGGDYIGNNVNLESDNIQGSPTIIVIQVVNNYQDGDKEKFGRLIEKIMAQIPFNLMRPGDKERIVDTLNASKEIE